MSHENAIQQAAALLRTANRMVVLTGAGVSKESGVPTFRDALEGLWEQYDPQELATPDAYQRDPKLVWDWYQHRRDMANQASPNPGHQALANLEAHFPHFPLITQNVDDLHEQAGSTNVIHLHGNLAGTRCFYDCQGKPTPIDLNQIDWNRDNTPPACPHCGRKSARPDVVWFGEMLPERELSVAAEVSAKCDTMLVVGTSGMVTPAARLPGIAKQSGATIIEVNPDTTMITSIADLRLGGPSGEMLPKLVAALA